MVRVKIDNRIRTLIENGSNQGHRTLFMIVGEKSRDQVITLYHILTKTQVKAKPSVLWCYKKELGFSTHRKKRMKELQKLKKAGLEVDDDNPLDMFIASANVRWCYYHETEKILGQTYGMAVLQDFEAIQPNILARTIETVEGGGVVVILLNTLHSLKQLYTMSMDVHARYRTESHHEVVSRFNERFILSLIDCQNSCIIDDRFNVLPVCSHILNIKPIAKSKIEEIDQKLVELKRSLGSKQPISSLVAQCVTVDQAYAVIKFSETLAKKTTRATVSLTAARGRGKSAALGLSIAAAIAYGYSNIYVTSPSPENLHTLFEFVVKGLKAQLYTENNDFTVIKSKEQDQENVIVRINVQRSHNQTIQYLDPKEASQNKLSIQMSNLFVVDEAAAIPLPIVKTFLNSQLVFLSSTVNGYEGTGRSLSLKLLSQLRQNNISTLSSRLVHELTLQEPIRYKPDDPIENWLTNLLCLDATIAELPWTAGCPLPASCQLYHISRDTLFSYHKTSEAFLQQLMALYVASHYKNTPNDLQMISDAPAHHLFCLLPPGNKTDSLPEVLCFIQVCLEGEISKEVVINSLTQGRKGAAGDLIPWTVSRQFNDTNFASLSGARIVRIATNPNYQKMGYGSRALQLLYDYYCGKFELNLSEDVAEPSADLVDKPASAKISKSKKDKSKLNNDNDSSMHIDKTEGNEEDFKPRANLPPLLLGLGERKPEKLDYMGVSYGLTPELMKFWKRNNYLPVYIRQTASDITGEHSCIMLRRIIDPTEEEALQNGVVVDEEQVDMELDASGAGADAPIDVEINQKKVATQRQADWLQAFFKEFRADFIELLANQFSSFDAQLSVGIVRAIQKNKDTVLVKHEPISKDELNKFFLTSRKLAILELYSKTLVDYHQIVPLMFRLSKLYFLDWLSESVDLSAVQATILLGMGVQGKSVNKLAAELTLEPTQLLGLFNRAVRKLHSALSSIEEAAAEKQVDEEISVVKQLDKQNLPNLEPMKVSLAHELNKEARKMKKKSKKHRHRD